MNTMKKRVLSSVLAVAAASAMALPAFAEDPVEDTPTNQTVVTGAYEDTPIDVVVDATGTAVINPYGLGVEITDSNSKKYNVAGQIMTQPMSLQNKTQMYLEVGAKVTTTVAGPTDATKRMKLSTEALDPESTAKTALVKLQVIPATGVTGDADTVPDKIIKAYAESDWKDAKELIMRESTDEKPVTVSSTEALVTLAGAKHTDGAFASFNDGSIALVRMTGDCVVSPKVAWTEEDGFVSTIVYSFTPVDAPETQG